MDTDLNRTLNVLLSETFEGMEELQNFIKEMGTESEVSKYLENTILQYVDENYEEVLIKLKGTKGNNSAIILEYLIVTYSDEKISILPELINAMQTFECPEYLYISIISVSQNKADVIREMFKKGIVPNGKRLSFISQHVEDTTQILQLIPYAKEEYAILNRFPIIMKALNQTKIYD